MTEKRMEWGKNTFLSTRKSTAILFVAAFSAFLATFNETFLNVAFSSIMTDLGVGISTVQWLATAYMLGAAIMIPVSAFLYRSIPTVRLYLSTVGLLVVGSLVGAFAENFSLLLTGRIIQALGTGMLIPISMNITLEIAPKQKLGMYMGIMGAMTTLGPSSSVIIAGLLLAFTTWHTMLFVFGGLSAVCFLCGLFFLKDVAELTYPKLDYASPILIGVSLIGILYGISTSFSRDVHGIIVAAGSVAVGVVFLIVFLIRQRRLTEPLIDLKPLSIKPFSLSVLINMVSLIVIFAMNIVMPLFMQSAMGSSPLAASFTLFPAIMLSCVVAPIAGRIYDKHGAKILLPLGFSLISICTFALSSVKEANSLVLLSVLYIPVICGSALVIGPVQSYALSHLTPEQNSHGVTIMSTGFQIAGCIGASLFSGIYCISASAYDGFGSSCLLGTAFAIFGLILALFVNRLGKKERTV